MDLILGTSDLALIRRRLSALLPQRPSLLAEAFASGLGHATHAAALAVMSPLDANSRAFSTVPFDPVAFAERLGPEAIHRNAAVVTNTLRACGVVAEGPDIADRYQTACAKASKRPRNPVEEYTKSGLLEVEKFAFMAWTLDWRMGHTGWLLDWHCRWAQPSGPFGLRLHRRIAAACELHADLDPDMALFLSDVMQALDRVELIPDAEWPMAKLPGCGNEEDDSEVQRQFDRFRWMEDVYSAFRPRIRNFLDKVSRCWDSAVDPLTLEPIWEPRPSRMPHAHDVPRYPGVTVGLTTHAKRCRFVPADTGRREIGWDTIKGLPAFAMWRSGAPANLLEAYAAQASDFYADPSDAVCTWVNLDGTGGSPASRKALLHVRFPDGIPARPDERAERERERLREEKEDARKAALPPFRSVDDAALVDALADPARTVAVLGNTDERLDGLSIDLDGGRISLTNHHPKGGKSYRTIPVPSAEMAEAMRSWLDACRSRGTPTPGNVEAAFEVPGASIRVSFKETRNYAGMGLRVMARFCGAYGVELDAPLEAGEEDISLLAASPEPLEILRLLRGGSFKLRAVASNHHGCWMSLIDRKGKIARRLPLTQAAADAAIEAWTSVPDAQISTWGKSVRSAYVLRPDADGPANGAVVDAIVTDTGEGGRLLVLDYTEVLLALPVAPAASGGHPLPFGAPKAISAYERAVLETRDIVVSRLTPKNTMDAVAGLVGTGLMRQVPAEDGGYGRRRFTASFLGMRTLVSLTRRPITTEETNARPGPPGL